MKTGKNTIVYHPELSNIHETVEFGDDCRVHSHVWIGEGVKAGNRCKIQAFAFIPPGVTLEDEVFIGPCVAFANDKHPPSHGKGWSKVLVKRGAVIGLGARIVPTKDGLTIGENAVVGAGALVLKDVLPNTTVVGVPARPLAK